MVTLPEKGFLRINDILGVRKKNIPAIIPVSRSNWWAGVKSGRYPRPLKLSKRITVWRVEDVRRLIDELGQGKPQDKPSMVKSIATAGRERST